MTRAHADQVSRPLRVAFVENAASMGGVEYSTLYLVQNLDPQQWQAQVICPWEGDLPRACREAGVSVQILPRSAMRSTSIRLRNGKRLPDPSAWVWDAGISAGSAVRLARLLKQMRPDVVVTKGVFSHLYGGLAAAAAGVPCVWHVQDFISERFGGLYRRGFGQMGRLLATHIVTDGGPIKRQFPSSAQQKVDVVFNGVNTTEFCPGKNGDTVRRELGLPPSALVVGHAARITPWKGQHFLLEAFARIAERIPDARLLFVGSAVFDNDAYEKRLWRRTEELGLQDRVVFAGYRHDLAAVLATMDLFAYTSVEKDTSPLALLSAMASGLPLVAFDIEGVREVVGSDGSHGRLLPVEQTEALALTLQELLTDRPLREALGYGARRRAEEAFSIETYVTHMEQILRRALPSGAHAVPDWTTRHGVT